MYKRQELICIIQYGELGTLFSLIQNQDSYFDSFRSILIFFKKLVEGVYGIHKKNIIHADLKLDNIAVTTDYDPLIFDFDRAVPANEINTLRGTKNYIAPEINRSKKFNLSPTYTNSVDLYALGVIFYLMVKKNFPIQHRIFDLDDMMNKEIHFDKGDYVVFRDIIKSLICLKKNRINENTLHNKLVKALLLPNFEELSKKESYYLYLEEQKQDLKVSVKINEEKEEKSKILKLKKIQDKLPIQEKNEVESESFNLLETILISLVSLIFIILIGIFVWFKSKNTNRLTTKSFTKKLEDKNQESDWKTFEEDLSQSHV